MRAVPAAVVDAGLRRRYMTLMDAFLPILLVFAILAVVGVLVAGIVSFAINGEFYQKNSNILMRWRVGLQAAAVLILGLIMLLQFGR